MAARALLWLHVGMSGMSRFHFNLLFGAPVTDNVEVAFTTSEAREKGEKGKTRVMYIECKGGGLEGPARIGRVSFSKSGRTLYYRGRKFQSLKGRGFKSNFYDVETGEHYWISGPKRNGGDALYGGGGAAIDEDCRAEYWTTIRNSPERAKLSVT